MKLITFLSLLAALALPSFAPAAPIPTGDLLRLGLLPPESVSRHLSRLSLQPDQEESLRQLMDTARQESPALETAIREYRDLLEEVIKNPATPIPEAETRLNKLLDAEADAKRLQLRTILGINAILTAEQRAQGLALAARDAALEPVIQAKVERIKAAVDGLGVKPTQAIEERGQAIREKIESGDLEAASAALDKAILDLGIDDTAAAVATVDFSAQEPGATDLPTLETRFRSVEEKVQGVTRLSTLRQFLQARDALEAAKAAEDAVTAGQVLSWAESVLQ